MADFSGAAGQNLAEDTLWDAAGDVAYGTGSDTGAVLTIGSACDVLVVACGLPSWGTAPQSTGALDNGTNNITSGGTWSVDVDATGTDGSDLYGAGTLRFGASQDLRIYHGGSHNYITGVSGDLVLTTDGDGNGIIFDAEDDTVEIKYSGTTGATFGTGGLCIVSGDAYSIAGNSVLNATTIGTAVVTSSLTTVGALDSGSITSGFGTIDTGSSAITTTGAITGGSLVADNFTLNGTELDLSSGDFTLDVAGDVEVNADGGDISFKDCSLALAVIRNCSNVGELRLHEAANYVGFKAPALSANQTWTLPTADGNCGQVLSTNGSGVLSWACGGSGGCARSVAGDTDNGIITWVTSDNTFAAEANLTYDATTLTVTKDADSEVIGLKLTNQSDSANTCGFISLAFDLEDTGGNAVDSGKIAVKKEASFTATAGTQDSSMEFHTSLNGSLTEKMTLNSAGNLSIDGALTATTGITVGSAGCGADVTFHSATSGDNFLWDSSCEKLVITGTNGQTALCVADGDALIVDTLYFYDRGGEHIASNGSVLTITGTVNLATALDTAYGGTGLTCLTAGSVMIGNGTSDVTLVAMTTKGHILIGDGSGAPQALGVGSNCQVLTAASGCTTGVKWATVSAAAVPNPFFFN